MLIERFTEALRLQWPESEVKPDSLDAMLSQLSSEEPVDGQWVPPADRRPLDEFYDVQSVDKNCIEGPIDISENQDGQLLKYIMKVSTSQFKRTVESEDVVHYLHETRYDNGQLVDFEEKRKAKEKFEMAGEQQHEHLRKIFLTTCKGEIAWIDIGPSYHGNIYHTYCKKDHLAKDAVIGDRIWIKITVEGIKRQPPFKDKGTWKGKLEYFNTIRTICKELIAEDEYPNAQKLYSTVLGDFKNLRKDIREGLTE